MKTILIYIGIFIIFCDISYSQNTITIPFTTGSSNLMYVDVSLNGYSTGFIFDTGASGISISSTIYNAMLSGRYLSKNDIIGSATVIIANGSTSSAKIIKLNTVSIGGLSMSNINAFVMPDANAPLLVGQNLFRKFGKVTIDYSKEEIILDKTNFIANTSLKIDEIRIIPCIANQSIIISKIKHGTKINVKTFTEETNIPPQKAIDRIKGDFVIRYFDLKDYEIAKQIKEELENQFAGYNIIIENMLPYYNYKSIPSYIEIWIN